MADDPNHDLILTRTLEIQGSMGAFPLVECEDFEFTIDRSIEVAVSTAGPIGFQVDNKGGAFTLNVFSAKSPEVNWYRLMESGEKVIFTAQDVDEALAPCGHRIQYRQCKIETVDPKTSNDGKQMLAVKGKYLGLRVTA